MSHTIKRHNKVIKQYYCDSGVPSFISGVISDSQYIMSINCFSPYLLMPSFSFCRAFSQCGPSGVLDASEMVARFVLDRDFPEGDSNASYALSDTTRFSRASWDCGAWGTQVCPCSKCRSTLKSDSRLAARHSPAHCSTLLYTHAHELLRTFTHCQKNHQMFSHRAVTNRSQPYTLTSQTHACTPKNTRTLCSSHAVRAHRTAGDLSVPWSSALTC